MIKLKIFIDPGHGGYDPGATGNGLQEKDVVLFMALCVKEMLKGYACEVRLSRERDVFLSLSERGQIANEWGADFFLSLHANGHKNSQANGYEDFIHPAAGMSTVRIREELHKFTSGPWCRYDRANRGMKTANFQVLRETRMSAVLMEHGFISNPIDADILRSSDSVRSIAGAIVLGMASALGLVKESALPQIQRQVFGTFGGEYLQEPMYLIEGVTYIPLRGFAERFGAQVNWDGAEFHIPKGGEK